MQDSTRKVDRLEMLARHPHDIYKWGVSRVKTVHSPFSLHK